MFERHLKSVLLQLVKAIRPDLLIADIDRGVEARELHIDPIGILRSAVKKTGVSGDPGIYRVLESIRKARLIKGLILMGRKIDLKIAFRSRRIGTVAARQKYCRQSAGAEKAQKQGYFIQIQIIKIVLKYGGIPFSLAITPSS
jgi:hypothetical protein